MTAAFGDRAAAALDVLALADYAWHDCYGESALPERVLADVLTCANGDLELLARAALTAVIDSRDVHVWALTVIAGGS